jgi:hypothetical protein
MRRPLFKTRAPHGCSHSVRPRIPLLGRITTARLGHLIARTDICAALTSLARPRRWAGELRAFRLADCGRAEPDGHRIGRLHEVRDVPTDRGRRSCTDREAGEGDQLPSAGHLTRTPAAVLLTSLSCICGQLRPPDPGSLSRLAGAQNARIWTECFMVSLNPADAHIGGSVRGPW